MISLVSIIIPAYNEAENIPHITSALGKTMETSRYEYEIIIVNDGSTDSTARVIQELSLQNPHLLYIELSKNYGHQLALKAGMDHAKGDCVISMDCDMQHPPEMIPSMLEKWEEGYEVVYTLRKDDAEQSRRKRITSKLFYKIVNKIANIHLEDGTADFRLVDRRIVDILKKFKENDPFLRGLLKWIGFRQYAITYQPGQRYAGKSKYTLRKMLSLAIHGVMSFSIRPLYLAVYLGLGFSALSVLYIPYVLFAFYSGTEVPGWASVIMTIVFFGGLQLSVLGIIGIYVGKIFMQTKNRPNYIVRATNIVNQSYDIAKF